MSVKNVNLSSYARNIELVSAQMSAVAEILNKTAEGVHATGNVDLATRLQALALDLAVTDNLLGRTVIEERQRLITFLKDAPLAQSQDLESPRPTYPTVFVDKPSRTLPNA